MKKVFAVTAALALLSLGGIAQAAITIDTVAVGDKGNAADTLTGYGSVAYNYNIGKYEVTAEQYTAFLNAVAATDTYGLYNTQMDTAVYSLGCNIKRTGSSGSYSYSVANNSTDGYWANRPVNLVSFWDSCRFANWLGNGQKTGAQDASTTERGAYTLDGYNGTDGHDIKRNPGATWAVTSEDEWYKAAYYKGGSTTAEYWLYPTESNTAPANQVQSTDPGNSANYYINNYSIGSPYYRTNVGEFEKSGSAYGTFDQGGNVWECNEGIVYEGSSYVGRDVRGGSFDSVDYAYTLRASYRSCNFSPTSGGGDIGFRVSEVPEPSSIIALAVGLGGLSACAFSMDRKGRKRQKEHSIV